MTEPFILDDNVNADWIKRVKQKRRQIREDEDLEKDVLIKAFYSQKYGVWLQPLGPGQKPPEGARVFTGKRGGSYYVVDRKPKGSSDENSIHTTSDLQHIDLKDPIAILNETFEESVEKLDAPSREGLTKILDGRLSQKLSDDDRRNYERIKEAIKEPRFGQGMSLFSIYPKSTGSDLVPPDALMLVHSSDKRISVLAFVGNNEVFEAFQHNLCLKALLASTEELVISPEVGRSLISSERLASSVLYPYHMQRLIASYCREHKLIRQEYEVDETTRNESRFIGRQKIFVKGKHVEFSPTSKSRAARISREVISAIEILPPEHVKAPTLIDHNKQLLRELEGKNHVPRKSWYGCYTHSGLDAGRIVIESTLPNTIIHEIGHSVWYKLLTPNETSAFEALRRSKGDPQDWRSQWSRFVSNYSKTNVKEDFAESYRAYVTNPVTLYTTAPDVYDFMDKVVFKRNRGAIQ